MCSDLEVSCLKHCFGAAGHPGHSLQRLQAGGVGEGEGHAGQTDRVGRCKLTESLQYMSFGLFLKYRSRNLDVLL